MNSKPKKKDIVISRIDKNTYIKYNDFVNRKLYHGSPNIIEKPEFGIGNPHNDYGLGFYCATNELLSREWAGKRTGSGYVNIYSLRDDNYRILDLTKPPFDNVPFWVALLMESREISEDLRTNYPLELKYLRSHYLIDVKKYDIVIGYRADDSYFRFPEAFVRGEITLESLSEIFKAGKLGKQYVLISPRAFKNLRFVGYYEVSNAAQKDCYKRKERVDKTFKELLLADRYSSGKRLKDLAIEDEENK